MLRRSLERVQSLQIPKVTTVIRIPGQHGYSCESKGTSPQTCLQTLRLLQLTSRQVGKWIVYTYLYIVYIGITRV